MERPSRRPRCRPRPPGGHRSRSKEDLVTAAAIDAKSWTSIIKLLVENGLVVSQGKLRATRYTLVPQPR